MNRGKEERREEGGLRRDHRRGNEDALRRDGSSEMAVGGVDGASEMMGEKGRGQRGIER